MSDMHGEVIVVDEQTDPAWLKEELNNPISDLS